MTSISFNSLKTAPGYLVNLFVRSLFGKKKVCLSELSGVMSVVMFAQRTVGPTGITLSCVCLCRGGAAG